MKSSLTLLHHKKHFLLSGLCLSLVLTALVLGNQLTSPLKAAHAASNTAGVVPSPSFIGRITFAFSTGVTFHCSGTNISQFLVLTAAHCLYNPSTNERAVSATYVPGQTRPFDGDDGTDSHPVDNDRDESPYGSCPVTAMTPSENYNPAEPLIAQRYDYALLQVASTCDLSRSKIAINDRFIQPQDIHLGDQVTALGYPSGSLGTGGTPKANVGFIQAKLTDGALETTYPLSEPGMSGGPLVLNVPGYPVIGILSKSDSGVSFAVGMGCSRNGALHWLQDKLGKTLCK